MYIKVDLYTFREQFRFMGRDNHFTYEGLKVLFDYLESLEFCEEQYELDVIGLCCDFAEDEPRGIAEDYNIDVRGMDDEQVAETVKEYLDEHTIVVGETDTTIVYSQF